MMRPMRNLDPALRATQSAVKTYFEARPDKLLVINVAEHNSARRITDFLDIEYTDQQIPHLNRSASLKKRR